MISHEMRFLKLGIEGISEHIRVFHFHNDGTP